MNVSIVCVGKVKDKYILDGIAEFQKRLQAFTKFDIIEVKEYGREQTIAQSTEKETEELLRVLEKNRRLSYSFRFERKRTRFCTNGKALREFTGTGE